jgi:thymidylate kinase
MSVGLLINLEAVDKAGKSTQAARIVRLLREAGVSAASKSFPSRPAKGQEPLPEHFATGVLINRYLDEQIVLIEGRDTLFRRESLAGLEDAEKVAIAGIIEEKLFQVIMSINRREGIEGPGGLLELLAQNDVVVVERALSAQAYGVVKGSSPVMIAALEGDLPKPDLSFLLEIDPAIAKLRRSEETPDRYEADPNNQRMVRDRYNEMVREDLRDAERERREPRFVRIDASKSIEEISDQIIALILKRLRRPGAGAG